jgi:hypothetical protein
MQLDQQAGMEDLVAEGKKSNGIHECLFVNIMF